MKKILLLLGLLVFIGGFVAYKMYNKPHKNIQATKTDFAISTASLFAEYESDENAANAKYLDKMLEVTGKVLEVNTDEQGRVGVTLDGGGMMFGVICKLDELSEHQRREFAVGEEVTFKGICTGILMDVVLERCVEL